MLTASLSFNPAAFPCVRIVGSFDELVSTRFAGTVNALCWPRELTGDFAEIEQCIPEVDAITSMDEEDLRALELSPAGAVARDQLIRDQRLLTSQALDPSLDIVPATEPDMQGAPIRTDVGDWHVDSATVEADTYLCSYLGAASEGIRNENATCQIDVAATREKLRQSYGGADDAAFRAYLSEHFYDLHYANSPDARIYSFGIGHLWRIATQYPGSPVPPCIHRAPAPTADRSRRLLLIS
jgi:hypothetical protein